MPDNTPLSILLESTKGRIISAVNEILKESKLPAHLTEGIFLEILSDLRNQKNFELMMDYTALLNRELNKEEKEESVNGSDN